MTSLSAVAAGSVAPPLASVVPRRGRRTLGTWLEDAFLLLLLALAFPLAILVVGTPLALLVRVLIEIGRRWF